MNIYPQDLGPEAQAQVLQARTVFPADTEEYAGAPIQTFPVAAGVFTALAVSVIVGGIFHSLPLTVVLFIVIAMVMSVRSILMAPLRGQKPVMPLTTHEVREAQQAAKDTLTRRYLELVITAINTLALQEAEAEQSVREALLALGTSLAALPPHPSQDMTDNPTALKAEAAHLATEAATEDDAVVASSLRRRAEALTRQAEIAARTATLLRRNDSLRQEIAGQIGALNTCLAAFRVGGSQSVYELAGVAASIQSVAIEASAITQAREEIDTALAQPYNKTDQATQIARR